MSRFSQFQERSHAEPLFRQQRARTVKLYATIVIVLLGGLVAGYFLGRPVISKWRYARDLKMAEQFEKEGDWRSAMLSWEQLNRLHPKDAEARRRLAAFYERVGQIESVVVWKEALALDPGHVQAHLGLARAAVRFGDPVTARDALEKIPEAGRGQAEYHRLRAGLAVLERDARMQEESLAALARLEPDDQRVRLNLAVVRLRDPHGPQAPAARATLLELARGGPVRLRAVTELLGDLARRWPEPAPARDAALRALAGALTPARGPLLTLPSQVDHVERLIRYAMEQPDPEVEDVISLANWMSLNGQTAAALEWIDRLPPSLTGQPLLRTAQTELAIRGRDWPRLHALLLAGAWGAVPAEAVEQAFLARNAPPPARAGAVRSGWSAAVEAGRTSPAGLRLLLRLAELWEWPAEQRLVLLTIARTLPRETWAWRRLISEAVARNDSEQVWQIYVEWRLALPGDPVVQVESTIMGCLLGRRRIATTAETADLLRRHPDNPGAAVAHALSLWRAGRPAEAVSVLALLDRAVFREPRYALAAGVVYAEAGRAAESAELLDRLAGEELLPEEHELVAAARRRNLAAGH